MTGAPSRTPAEAMDRWLNKRRPSVTDATLSTLQYRLKLFVDWCDEQGIEKMAELDTWDIDEYEIARREQAKSLTLNKELRTLQQWLEYCQQIGLVSDDLAAAVTPPEVSKHEQSDDTMLAPTDGEGLLEYYRESPDRASRAHVLLELLWTVGCRAGGLVALDVRDVDVDDNLLAFEHRPETGTPLKNGPDGQRMVGLLDETVAVLEQWIAMDRPAVSDDHGRQPLVPSQQGRPQPGTVRDWCYSATLPCIRTACPHDKHRSSCEWVNYSRASNCPSSRSPHQVRTGSITWQLSRGVPIETVSKRVNASVDTIKKHYDKEDPRRDLELRRRDHIDNLSLEDDDDD